MAKRLAFSHRGARNSFTEMPICPYERGETQKHHFNHTGIEAAVIKYTNLSLYLFPVHEFEVDNHIIGR